MRKTELADMASRANRLKTVKCTRCLKRILIEESEKIKSFPQVRRVCKQCFKELREKV